MFEKLKSWLSVASKDDEMTATRVQDNTDAYWEKWKRDKPEVGFDEAVEILSTIGDDLTGGIFDDPIVRTEEFASSVDRRIEFDDLCHLVSQLGHKSKQCHAGRRVYPILAKEHPKGMEVLGKQVWWT